MSYLHDLITHFLKSYMTSGSGSAPFPDPPQLNILGAGLFSLYPTSSDK
jgi:hypothetical protein